MNRPRRFSRFLVLFAAAFTTFASLPDTPKPTARTLDLGQKCYWVETPETTISYTPWENMGQPDGPYTPFHWRRVCRTTCTGTRAWINISHTKHCDEAYGDPVQGEPGVPVLGSWYYTVIHESDTTTGTNIPVTTLQEDFARTGLPLPPFGGLRAGPDPPPCDTMITLLDTMYTHQNLVHAMMDTDAWFDNVALALDEKVDLLGAGVGQHEYLVIANPPCVNPVVDTILTVIEVLPSFELEVVFDGTSIVPFATVRFTNHSPDTQFVDFDVAPMQTGLEVGLFDNQQEVLPGSWVDLVVEFYTEPGWVALPGQKLIAQMDAYAGFIGNEIIATTTVCAYASNVTAVPDRGPPKLVVGQNVPNPFSDQTLISFEISSSSHIELRIYDVKGRLVRQYGGDFSPADLQQFVWDGRDGHGRPMPSGVYFYTIESGTKLQARKALLLR
jgi:hypothetical protein